MKRKLLLLLLLAWVGTQMPLWAQTDLVQISGQVKDEKTGESLPGVTITVKGTVTGTTTDMDGKFVLKTRVGLPLTLVFSFIGYDNKEYEIKEPGTLVNVSLNTQSVLVNDVVVTASKVEESIINSPVSIEKLDIRSIKSTPQPSFFDAIESVKGVQMTTLSIGFKVPNTRGFTNTTNARFLFMVDGADSQAPGLGVSIANTVGPTELDIQSVEITPGASSALYGMNALNGIANMITKSPFTHKGLSLYQKVGINHVDGVNYGPQPLTETAVRYAKAFNNKFAFKVNVGYFRATDWVADSDQELNPNANSSTGLFGADNPAQDPLNSYGNENSNRRTLTLADGKRYEVRRTGYWEKDLVNNDYKVDNLKADFALHYKIKEKWEISYAYRVGKSDAIYQRGNRIRLDDYWIQQHKVELRGQSFLFRSYYTQENTTKSYNLRPMGETLDLAFKSNNNWFTDYQNQFNTLYGNGASIVDAHNGARTFADSGRYQPGTPEYDAKLKELAAVNNWDVGAQLRMEHKFVHAEGQYDFTEKIKFFDLLAGVDFRDFIITPEGNSFKNPGEDSLALLHYYKIGGFVQASKQLFNNKLKVIASVRVDKQQHFTPKANPRVAVVVSPTPNQSIRFSYQNGYRFPTLFEGFSTVNNGGVIRYGGLDIMSNGLFENSYIRSSVDAFQKAVTNDINVNGLSREDAIKANAGLLVRSEYTYLKPEHINTFEVGYKGLLFNNKLFIDADFYYNIYQDFIDQIEISVPKTGTIGVVDENGIDSTIFAMENLATQTRYRMWTNTKGLYHNYGTSVGVTYNFYKNFTLSGNYSYSKLAKIDDKDAFLETPFNTPAHIVNLGFGNREVYKNLGFQINWRWQSAFDWKSPLANGVINAYNTLDLQVTYKVPKIYSTFKLGASNALNQRYTQYTGGPEIGGLYYLAITVDGLLSK